VRRGEERQPRRGAKSAEHQQGLTEKFLIQTLVLGTNLRRTGCGGRTKGEALARAAVPAKLDGKSRGQGEGGEKSLQCSPATIFAVTSDKKVPFGCVARKGSGRS